MLKNTLAPLGALVLVLALAFVSNPSAERHRAKIKEAIADSSPIAGLLGLGSLTAFVSNYHSFGVGSYTRNGDRLLSVGAFGMVFVLN